MFGWFIFFTCLYFFFLCSEWAVNIQRDSYASYIGHYPLLAYFAVAENESIGRERYSFMQVLLFFFPLLSPLLNLLTSASIFLLSWYICVGVAIEHALVCVACCNLACYPVFSLFEFDIKSDPYFISINLFCCYLFVIREMNFVILLHSLYYHLCDLWTCNNICIN